MSTEATRVRGGISNGDHNVLVDDFVVESGHFHQHRLQVTPSTHRDMVGSRAVEITIRDLRHGYVLNSVAFTPEVARFVGKELQRVADDRLDRMRRERDEEAAQ